MLEGRQEAEINMAGSICHRGCSRHHSCHCWVNKPGKMIVLQVKNDLNHAAELIVTPLPKPPPLLFCMSSCSVWLLCAERHAQTKMESETKRGEKKRATASVFGLIRAVDWLLCSGFPHATNWIHRSLDTVHKRERFSLKTREDRQENGEVCEGGQYWWGCLVQDQ